MTFEKKKYFQEIVQQHFWSMKLDDFYIKIFQKFWNSTKFDKTNIGQLILKQIKKRIRDTKLIVLYNVRSEKFNNI